VAHVSIWIALLRGINVGGRNLLPMGELRQLLEANGYSAVRTYIQSGNVVFASGEPEARRLPARIGDAILATRGFRPKIIVLGVDELTRAIESNPLRGAFPEPKSLHLFFLDSAPEPPDAAALDAVRADNEAFAIVDTVLYLYAPDGIGRSKLAASVEKLLCVEATARNWRTVNKLSEIARETR